MAVLNIPLTTAPKQVLTVQLEDSSYRLRIRWNTVMAAWYMDVSGIDGTALASGIRMVTAYPLPEGNLAGSGLWERGALMVVAQDGSFTEPTREGWGSTYHLLYIPKA